VPGVAPAHTAVSASVSFRGGGAFFRELREEVGAVLLDGRALRRARRQLISKTLVGVCLLWASWGYLVFDHPDLLQALPGFVGLLVGATIMSVCVMHDGNHGAFFSRRTRWSRILGWGIDVFLGFSSYAWRIKHDVHHAYPNVDGYDDDIDHAPVLRIAPSHERRSWHRWQHLYVWPLYAIALLRWHLTDLLVFRRTRLGPRNLTLPTGWERLGLIAGKSIFLSWAIVLPALFDHRWWVVLSTYLFVTIVGSFFMAIVFQLAHCGEEASFLTTSELASTRPYWAVHEVESTADFCQTNQPLTWVLGGLNFQIEHHLFPRYPHPLYPQIAPIVRRVAEKYDVHYVTHSTLREALAAHYRLLKKRGVLGLPVQIEMG
jgi:linoleoyl-CoA desaturase